MLGKALWLRSGVRFIIEQIRTVSVPGPCVSGGLGAVLGLSTLAAHVPVRVRLTKTTGSSI